MAVDDAYTKTLFHFNGDNNGTVITDESGVTWTRVNAVTSTTQIKFGSASGYFGTSSYIYHASDADFGFGTGDFTVDFWVYPLDSGGIRPFIDWRNNNAEGPCWLGRAADGTLRSYEGTLRTGGAISQDAWSHIAWVRASGANRIYVNGVAQHIFTNAGDYGASKLPGIGRDRDDVNFYGYIDEFRCSKGIARWTADFDAFLPAGEYMPNSTNYLRGRSRNRLDLSPISLG